MEQLANAAQTTVASGLNNTTDPVTFVVASAALFPTEGNFRVLVDTEILLVTAVAGTSFTADRAQEGTSVAPHANGSIITNSWTAGAVLASIRDYTIGGYRVSGLVGANNSGTPATQFDLAADLVQLWNPSNNAIVVRTAVGSLTNNVLTAGPAANGRDQAGAFSAETWLHFYYIWNGAPPLATLSSTVAPPTGPALPTGYTHWAYAGAVYYTDVPALESVVVRGNTMAYVNDMLVIAGGEETSETFVDLTSVIPPNALDYLLSGGSYCDTDSFGSISAYLATGLVSGVEFGRLATLLADGLAVSAAFWGDGRLELPNLGQTFWYQLVITVGSDPAAWVSLKQYTVPNGDV